jgi:hypothetical protein
MARNAGMNAEKAPMPYILIMVILGISPGGKGPLVPSIAVAEFRTQDACDQARQQFGSAMTNHATGLSTAERAFFAFCSPK